MTISVPVKFEISGDKLVVRGTKEIAAALDKAKQSAGGAQGAFGKTEAAARKTGRGFLAAHASVLRYVSAIGSGLMVRELLQASNALGNMENQLRLVTTSTSELERVQGDLLNIANESRQSLYTTGNLYARLARSVDGMGYSQQQLLEVTELTTKAVAIPSAHRCIK